MIELLALFVPVYRVNFFAGGAVIVSLLLGVIYALCTAVSMEEAAKRMDAFGLKERILTAYSCRKDQSPMASSGD